MRATVTKKSWAVRASKPAAVLVAAALLSSCAHNEEPSTGTSASKSLTQKAESAALTAAGGKKIGGKLSLIGVNAGAEGAVIESTLKPFEDATGIDIDYTGSSDANTLIQTRVDAGNAPDVVNLPNAGSLATYAKAGKLVPLTFMDQSKLKSDFAPTLLSSATVDGKLYGIWNEVDNFMIWYNAKTYKGPKAPADWAALQKWAKSASSGDTAPWCMGLASGAASGVSGAQFISNLFLYESGPEKLKQFAEGKLPFTSPEVASAFKLFGKIATSSKMVKGGATAALNTPTVEAGNGMFSSPQKCSMLGWGNYAGGLITAANAKVKPVTDLDFFGWPAVNKDYAKSQLVSGHVMYAFNDTPQVRAFMKYYASSEAQSLLADSGHWVVANQDVTTATYPNALIKKSAAQYKAADSVSLSPVSQLPAPVVMALYKGIVAYVQNPGSLNSILAGIEKTRTGATS
ncbi:ABC transporter substrate-binding protein [Streptomyces sp. NPDC059455]|uniref:ABC transporter substrate-binding protein n=1 Tax=Streptomyces sp. NPDC059455 TaxID=3346837 RepID=UPI0036979B26